MAWPTSKQEFIEKIDMLSHQLLTDDLMRDEDKLHNRILINAFRNDLKRLINDEDNE